jgi:hypothetical protein
VEDLVGMERFVESDEEKYYRSLREYSRVNAYLPVQVRLVKQEERESVRSRQTLESALTKPSEMPEIEDKALADCLQILNAKLDSIIRMLSLDNKDHQGLDLEVVNISAGGISTLSKQVFAEEDFVEIRLMLPTSPLMVKYVYGPVIKCSPESDKFRITVEFTEIDEDIREQIAKYVFERQREILRKKRRP